MYSQFSIFIADSPVHFGIDSSFHLAVRYLHSGVFINSASFHFAASIFVCSQSLSDSSLFFSAASSLAPFFSGFGEFAGATDFPSNSASFCFLNASASGVILIPPSSGLLSAALISFRSHWICNSRSLAFSPVDRRTSHHFGTACFIGVCISILCTLSILSVVLLSHRVRCKVFPPWETEADTVTLSPTLRG